MALKYKRLYDNSPYLETPKQGDAGYDIKSNANDVRLYPYMWNIIPTGIAFEIPKGYVGLIRGRSGLAFNENTFSFHGTLDSNFRGELKVKIRYEPNIMTNVLTGEVSYPSMKPYIINAGDKIAQLVIVPYFSSEVEEVNELSETNRGTNAFGSSGV